MTYADHPPASCAATTVAGTPCQAWPMTGAAWCYSHHPDQAGSRQAARARGGRNRATVRRLHARLPDSLERCSAVVADALEQVHAGTMAPARGQAVAALGRALAAIYADAVVEARLERVERTLEAGVSLRVVR